jgi:hypothetical protein
MPDDGQRNGMHMRRQELPVKLETQKLWTFFEKNHELSPKYHMAVFTQVSDLYR